MEGKMLKNAKTWRFLQRENIFDPDMIRTRCFLIWSQMCYPCTSVLYHMHVYTCKLSNSSKVKSAYIYIYDFIVPTQSAYVI